MIISIAFFAVIFSVNSLLIKYLTAELSSDVLYSDTILPMLLSYACELLELVAISVCYAAMICVLYRSGIGRIKSIFLIFVLSAVYKYLSSTVMSWVMSGSIPSLWKLDLVNVLYFTLLEFLQLLIIYLVIRPDIERFNKDRTSARKKSEFYGSDLEVTIPTAYPFEKIYDKRNCLCRSAFVCAIAVLIAKLFGDVSSDLWMILSGGLPSEWRTWVLMAVNYLSKAIFAVIAYFSVYIAVSLMLKGAEKSAK